MFVVVFLLACAASVAYGLEAHSLRMLTELANGAPSSASQVLDPRLASLSIELAYFPSFGGNLSAPNDLTRELMQRIEERTGVGPDVRPGGITVDSSIFDPNGPALNLSLSSTGGIYRTTYGPAFYESYAAFPNTSMFVVDVNLHNNSLDIARDELREGIAQLGWNRIRSLQLGNEMDQYESSYTLQSYVTQFLNWTANLTSTLDLPSEIFQAGGFAKDPTSSATMTTVTTIADGIDDTGVIKLFDQHMYQYSTCDPTRNAIATLTNLVNHTNITSYVDLWKPQIAAARGRGKEFVVGEYNSVSCSGKQNVSDTFGQALWLADTILYSASLNISRMYLHQGATLVLQSSQQANGVGFSWYDLWYPVASDRYGPIPHAAPSFVAYLLIAEAVGHVPVKSQIQLLSSSELGLPSSLAVYVIWDPKVRDDGGVARLVILNMSVRMLDGSGGGAAAVLDLTSYLRNGTDARVKRMTAPGLNSNDARDVTWAGQSFYSGVAIGQEVEEALVNGTTVVVQPSEAVLVFL